MNRSEYWVTIAGLIATFGLPWPQNDEALERPPTMAARSVDPGWTSVLPRLYGTFGRVRTGPTEGIQPTR